jgi:uncharacterized protein
MSDRWFERPLIPRVVPFALYILFLGVGQLASAFDTRWLYPVQVGLVAVALAFFWRRYEELPGPRTLAARHWVLASAVGVAVLLLWIRLDLPWLTVGDPGKGFDPRDAGRINVLLVVFRIAGAALVVPLMEELFWRSFVMRWIDGHDFLLLSPAAVTSRALLWSSVAFGFEHHLWFAGIIAGLAYGWLYRSTQNLWAPILAHSVTNGLLGAWVLYTGNWQFW